MSETGTARVVVLPPVGGGGGGDCSQLGVTDTFTRSAALVEHLTNGNQSYGAILGASDAGVSPQVQLGGGGVSTEVAGGVLGINTFKVTNTIGPGAASITYPFTAPLKLNLPHSFRFRMRRLPGVDSDRIEVRAGIAASGTALTININPSGTFYGNSWIGFAGGGTVEIANAYWQVDVWYTVVVVDNGVTSTASISNGVTTYQHSAPLAGSVFDDPYIVVDRSVNIAADPHLAVMVEVDDVDFPEMCNVSSFWVPDWAYYTLRENMGGLQAPEAQISAGGSPTDSFAQYTGRFDATPDDFGRSWLFADVDASSHALGGEGYDVYYEWTGAADHIIAHLEGGPDPDVEYDATVVWQVGAVWLEYFGEHVIVSFTNGGASGFGIVDVESNGGGASVGASVPFALPTNFNVGGVVRLQPGQRYSIRLYINRASPDGFDFRSKIWKWGFPEPASWQAQIFQSLINVPAMGLERVRFFVRQVTGAVFGFDYEGETYGFILESHVVGTRRIDLLEVDGTRLGILSAGGGEPHTIVNASGARAAT